MARPSTIRGYERTLRCFLRWAASQTDQPVTLVANFSADAVKRYIGGASKRHGRRVLWSYRRASDAPTNSVRSAAVR